MSAVPQAIQLKRKRGEQPPDALYVEDREGKRAFTGPIYELKDKVNKNEIRWDEDAALVQRGEEAKHNADAGLVEDHQASKAGSSRYISPANPTRRTFQLSKHALADRDTRKKRKHKEMATIVERTSRTNRVHKAGSPRKLVNGHKDLGDAQASPAPRKRPGTGSTTRAPNAEPPKPGLHGTLHGTLQSFGYENDMISNSNRINGLADTLHNFALEELARQPKPKLTFAPKVSPRRNKMSQESQVDDDDMDVDMDADADPDDDSLYVYDTYVLSAEEAKTHDDGVDFSHGNVGYLVITEEDQSVWESYLEDEEDDKDWNSEEEDENAEDYYGADYPEDEVASDDERGEGAYNYRNHNGSDDEEYDGDTATWSDDEEERMKNPWKKLFSHQIKAALDDDEDEDDDEE